MKSYNLKAVREKTLKYFKGDELATNAWIDKYALKNREGEILEEFPDDMHFRLAKEFARISCKYDSNLNYDDSFNEYFEFLHRFKYIIPGGSNMYGVGNNHSYSTLGNCFVIGNDRQSEEQK